MLLNHLRVYFEGVEQKTILLAKRFPKKSSDDLRILADRIDKKLIVANVQTIKPDEIDSLIEKAKNTKNKLYRDW